MITFVALAHMLDAAQLVGWVGGVVMMTFLELANMVDATHGKSDCDLEQVYSFSMNCLASGEQKVVRRRISGLPNRSFFYMLLQHFAFPIVNTTTSAEQLLIGPS